QHLLRLCSGNAREVRLDLLEAALPRLAWNRLRQLFERVLRSRTLGLEQRLMHRLYRSKTMNRKARNLDERHLCERAHLVAVALNAVLHCVDRRRILVM